MNEVLVYANCHQAYLWIFVLELNTLSTPRKLLIKRLSIKDNEQIEQGVYLMH